MRFRNRLLIVVLSVLIPAFAAAALAVWYVYSEEQKAQEKGLTEAARAFALLVDKELQVNEGILHTLAQSPSLEKEDLREFYSHAKSLAPGNDSAIILLEPDGRQLLNTRQPFGAELPTKRSSNMEELMSQYGADKTLISDIFIAPIGKFHDFVVQIPVKRGNQIRYFLVMAENAARLQPLLTRESASDQWIETILDRKGYIIARSRSAEQYVGKRVRERSRAILNFASEGMYQSVTIDGVPVKAFFSTIPHSDWKIILSIPEEEIRRAPLHAAAFLAAMMVALLMIAIAAAHWISKRAIKPIEYLGKTAEELGRGKEIAYIPQGLLEVDAVGQRIADASKKIQQSKMELEQRVAEAVATTERVQRTLLQSQKLEALGSLTAGIAHEFNNLLQTLTTALQLAGLTSNQPRVQSFIETCKKAVDRAALLTSQLGSFGRVQEARLETLQLNEHMDTSIGLIKGTLRSNITLELDLAPQLWPVSIDPLQFELALLNIAINAKDAMPKGGVLLLQASNQVLVDPMADLSAGDYVVVRVSDTGSGMTPEVLAKALDPFFTTKPVGQGTGLGLPQVYGFARQSHGTMLLKSVVGQGTTVELYLPRAKSSVRELAREAVKEKKNLVNGVVLFVEDDLLVREAVVPALVDAGLVVHVANTGDEALSMLESGLAIDVVFSDIVMPGGLSGIALANIIKDRFQTIKVILATGYTESEASIPGVRVLAKPYDMAAVVSLLASILEKDI